MFIILRSLEEVEKHGSAVNFLLSLKPLPEPVLNALLPPLCRSRSKPFEWLYLFQIVRARHVDCLVGELGKMPKIGKSLLITPDAIDKAVPFGEINVYCQLRRS